MVDWNTTGYTNKQDETIRILKQNVWELEEQLNKARKKIHGLNAKIAAAEDAAIEAKRHHDQVMADVIEMQRLIQEHYMEKGYDEPVWFYKCN